MKKLHLLIIFILFIALLLPHNDLIFGQTSQAHQQHLSPIQDILFSAYEYDMLAPVRPRLGPDGKLPLRNRFTPDVYKPQSIKAYIITFNNVMNHQYILFLLNWLQIKPDLAEKLFLTNERDPDKQGNRKDSSKAITY
jgi:hypothetical protein